VKAAIPVSSAVALFYAACGLLCFVGNPRIVLAQPDQNAAALTGDPGRGKDVFERRCTGCHALDADREGPHLRGVYGRKAGSVPGFDYSDALKNSGLVWGDDTLEHWLRDTDAMVPGSAMGFSVPKAQERADVIAFLKSIRQEPDGEKN
jgi:cytochrome c